jgi:hypothetical protein
MYMLNFNFIIVYFDVLLLLVYCTDKNHVPESNALFKVSDSQTYN